MEERKLAKQPRGRKSRIDVNPQPEPQRLVQMLTEINEVFDVLHPLALKVFNLLVLILCIVVLGSVLGGKYQMLLDAALGMELIKRQLL